MYNKFTQNYIIMHILIVEDNKAIADNEKRFLETEGFIVDVEYNGRM
jgi:DNA-binding response OmpR family regulator